MSELERIREAAEQAARAQWIRVFLVATILAFVVLVSVVLWVKERHEGKGGNEE